MYSYLCWLIISKVICQVHKIGLRVVATICDEGRANEGAINILKDETIEYCLKNNKLYRNDFYEVQIDSERIQIVHFFDVPHLINASETIC